MMSEQKRSSHVQTALVSKPLKLKIPDTAQMKDLLKSFQTRDVEAVDFHAASTAYASASIL